MPADYARLIDAETWAFIRETETWYPHETATFTIARQREVYDAMCRAFHRGYPEGIAAHDEALGGVPCRIYDPTRPGAVTVVYYHGGGLVVGGLESHDDVCAEICAGTGYRVVSADYRLCPEHRHPAAFDDALAVAYAAAERFGQPIVLAGDSQGGNLAATVAHAMRGSDVEVRGQVLIYPGLGGDKTGASYLFHAHAPMLTRDDLDFYRSIRYEDGIEPQADPTASPLRDTDFSGLPPTVAIGAECDPLCDDAAEYAARIRAAGGKAVAWVEPGLVHGYLRARVTVTRARMSFARIKAAITALAEGRLPEAPRL